MSHFRELYRVKQLPVFQNRMYCTKNGGNECISGDVIITQDMKTGLIFNQAFNSNKVQYDSNYQNEQAVSSLFREHLRAVSRLIHKNFHSYSLIEVGCGKGFFLEYLQSLGFRITGLDPIYEGSNPDIIKKYFTPQLDLCADGIILRHVLEHIQAPYVFLTNILESNGGGGKVYIEVPCFDWICQHHAWFDIFYEHVNYFRINDFKRMFGKVYESGYFFGGQYLYVVADLATIREPTFDDKCYCKFPKYFLTSVNRYANIINKSASKYSVIWGGASKGVIFAIFMKRAGVKVDFVVDINPEKQGKFLPVTGLLVHSPDEIIEKLEESADIFVMNSNYLNEIKQITNNNFNYITVDHENV